MWNYWMVFNWSDHVSPLYLCLNKSVARKDSTKTNVISPTMSKAGTLNTGALHTTDGSRRAYTISGAMENMEKGNGTSASA